MARGLRFIRLYLLLPLAAVIGVFMLFLGVATVCEFRPAEREVLYRSTQPQPLPDTLRVLSWNIGYGGLGGGMDFFFDGGERTRDSREQTEANLARITEVIRRTGADIVLLQEVDRDASRTYRIDEAALLQREFPEYTMVYGCNYAVQWVPFPLHDPLGRVEAGLVVLSRARPIDAVRLQYPSRFDWPMRLFNLKSCLLELRYLSAAGDTLRIGNTHNTAYDRRGMREQEMRFVRDRLSEAEVAGEAMLVGGDWNQYPPGYSPDERVLSHPHYTPRPADGALFGEGYRFVWDPARPTLRYLDEPLTARSLTTLTDFFLVPLNLDVLSVETIDEGFAASDHNPVLLRVRLGLR